MAQPSRNRAASKTGIQSKLGRVLLLQLVFISVATALGVYAAAQVVERVMIGTALQNEAAHFWAQRQSDPAHPFPNTDNLRGFGQRGAGADAGGIPAGLRAAPPGQSRQDFEGRRPIVYVEQRDGLRLVLVFDEQSVSKLSFWFGVVPLSLTLIVIYISSWFVYRQSSKTLSPLTSLAQAMREFDFGAERFAPINHQAWRGAHVDDEVRVLADAIEAFTRRLQRQLQREKSFSRDVSHELRTPLAVLRGSLELLQKQADLSPAQGRVVERMQTTSRDMQALIEMLLLLAKEEHGSQLAGEQTDVDALADQLLEQVAHSHNADGHLTMRLERRAALTVAAPAQVVSMVLTNLLRNACNYTVRGEVVAVVDGDGVEVFDTGAGMAAEAVQRLQQPFQRDGADGSGYGLGLDIVRRLCERYGWQLDIDSRPGEGTRVRVRMDPAGAAPHP